MAFQGQHSQNRKAALYGGLLIIAALALLTYGNYQFAVQNPGGVDFLHRWLPAQMLLSDGGVDVYSEATSLQIQMFRYGRPALPGEVPCLFAYPFYAIGFFMPFSLIKDFVMARALWTTLLEVSHILIILLALHFTGFKPRRITLTLLLIFSLFVSYLTQSLGNGNISSLSVLFVMLCLLCVHKRWDRLAGAALAISTIKPQLVILVFALICLWSISVKRWRIIIYAGLTLIALVGLSFIFQPDWLAGFIRQLGSYQEAASPHTPEAILSLFISQTAVIVSHILMAGSLGVLVFFWIRALKKEFSHLLWTVCMTFALLPLTGISSAKWNFIAQLPGFILIAAHLALRWKDAPLKVNLFILIVIILSWVAKIVELNYEIGGKNLVFFDSIPIALLLVVGMCAVRHTYMKCPPPTQITKEPA